MKIEIKVVLKVVDGAAPPPPPPPNTPEPQRKQQISSETSRLVHYYDTLDEDDVMSAAERLSRVNLEPIPPGATFLPGGEESDDDDLY